MNIKKKKTIINAYVGLNNAYIAKTFSLKALKKFLRYG